MNLDHLSLTACVLPQDGPYPWPFTLKKEKEMVLNAEKENSRNSNKKKKLLKRILLIRHGESKSNEFLKKTGRSLPLDDPPLTKQGLNEASALGNTSLGNLGNGNGNVNGGALPESNCAVLWVSPMTRTIQTADAAFLKSGYFIDWQLVPEMREYGPGFAQSLTGSTVDNLLLLNNKSKGTAARTSSRGSAVPSAVSGAFVERPDLGPPLLTEERLNTPVANWSSSGYRTLLAASPKGLGPPLRPPGDNSTGTTTTSTGEKGENYCKKSDPFVPFRVLWDRIARDPFHIHDPYRMGCLLKRFLSDLSDETTTSVVCVCHFGVINMFVNLFCSEAYPGAWPGLRLNKTCSSFSSTTATKNNNNMNTTKPLQQRICTDQLVSREPSYLLLKDQKIGVKPLNNCCIVEVKIFESQS